MDIQNIMFGLGVMAILAIGIYALKKYRRYQEEIKEAGERPICAEHKVRVLQAVKEIEAKPCTVNCTPKPKAKSKGKGKKKRK